MADVITTETADTTTAAPVAAEPVAAEPVAAEPVAAEPVAAAPEPPAFPDAAEFKWDEWDGENLDAFDEAVRPWLEKAKGRYDESWNTRLQEADEKASRFEAMYRALNFGEDDPRIGELEGELNKAKAYVSSLENEVRNLNSTMEARADAESDRYMNWLESTYGERMAANPAAMQASLTLLDAGSDENYFQPHQAFEIAELGEAAVAATQASLEKNWPVDAIYEVVTTKFKAPPAKPAVAPTPVNESARLVTGATPPRKPTAPPKKSLKGAELLTDSGMMSVIEQTLKEFSF